jgi:hypothetical protein
MVASGESQMRMMIVHSRFQGGFYLALVPAALSPEQIESPCRVREQAPILWEKRKNSWPPVVIAFAVIT